jgi:hypothetical protein
VADEILGLTPQQHADVGRLVIDSKTVARPETGAHVNRAKYPGIARVILIDADDPVYNPLAPRRVAIFRRNPKGSQKTIEFSGKNLEGDIILTIDGVEYRVPCSATAEELRAIVTIPLRDCRTTVFPGYWEFDFNAGRWSQSVPAFTVEPYEPPEDDNDTPVFDGGIIVTDEGWVSRTDDGDTYVTIETNDWIPFLQGAVKSGAIGSALWSHEAGWLSLAWQCRDFSFAGSY